MRDEDDRPSRPPERTDAVVALLLKSGVADREHFVDDQHVGLEVRSYRECESHVHSRRVAFHRRVDELFDFGEGHDLVELPSDLDARHAEDCAVQKDVLATRELGMKSNTDFQQARNAAIQVRRSLGRLGDPADDFQQRALARSVAADHADHFTVVQIERHVAKSPELRRRTLLLPDRAHRVGDAVAQRQRQHQFAELVLLPE